MTHRDPPTICDVGCHLPQRQLVEYKGSCGNSSCQKCHGDIPGPGAVAAILRRAAVVWRRRRARATGGGGDGGGGGRPQPNHG